MLDMEFLPAWYPQLRRRRRMVMLQAWATVLVVLSLGVWILISGRNTEHKLVERNGLAVQLEKSRSDLKELNSQLSKKEQLQKQDLLTARIGLNVEATRMLAKIYEVMPKEMTITEATFDTVEQAKASDPASGKLPVDVTRKMLVRLSGVTPSDADWADVLAKLISVPYFQDVRPIGAKDKSEDGHRMREFEVAFAVDMGNGE